MNPPLVADTGGLLRAIRGDGHNHPDARAFARELRAATSVIVPSLVLAEVDWFLRRQRAAMRKLAGEIFDPKFRFEFVSVTAADVVRGLQFDAKFADLELGLVDGVVAAIAERRGVFRVLTTDRSDFAAIRVGQRYNLALTLVP